MEIKKGTRSLEDVKSDERRLQERCRKEGRMQSMYVDDAHVVRSAWTGEERTSNGPVQVPGSKQGP